MLKTLPLKTCVYLPVFGLLDCLSGVVISVKSIVQAA